MHSLNHLKGNAATGLNEQFRSFADAMPCIVIIASAEGQIDYLNQRWAECAGVSGEGRGLAAWLDTLHSEDQATFVDAWCLATQAGKPFDLELRLWSQQDEKHRWQLLRVRPQLSSSGKVSGWVGICNDIHERKTAEEQLHKSEARLRALVDESPVGVVLLSTEGEPVFYNRKCVELRGQEVDLGQWWNVLHPDERERVLSSSRSAMKEGRAWSSIHRFLHPGGRTVWVSARTAPIRAGDELLGYVRTLEDISELKNAEEKLREANQQLQAHADQLDSQVQERTAHLREALAELDKLSYSIVHDMRAPLRTMHGFSSMLLEEHSASLDAQSKRYLQLIKTAATRQDRLIQDVLAYHACVRGQFELAPVNLDDVIGGILETYADFRPPKACVTVQRPLGWALAHETLLIQCISALLDNAVKFVPAGRVPEIIVGSDKSATEVKLWILDNGIGIAPACQGRLFEIFYKYHHPSEYPGTGIGLPLAKKAMDRMHGTIGVESTPGKGSKFWLALKAAHESAC